MRHAYIVTYDISSPKRLRKVYETMRGWGEHIQLSVFRCELNRSQLIELRDELGDIINTREDQVLFMNLGPAEGRGAGCITALGRPYLGKGRDPVVL